MWSVWIEALEDAPLCFALVCQNGRWSWHPLYRCDTRIASGLRLVVAISGRDVPDTCQLTVRLEPQYFCSGCSEEVAAGDQLGEIETDKASMSFDSSEDGFVAKHLMEAGSTADLGVVRYPSLPHLPVASTNCSPLRPRGSALTSLILLVDSRS